VSASESSCLRAAVTGRAGAGPAQARLRLRVMSPHALPDLVALRRQQDRTRHALVCPWPLTSSTLSDRTCDMYMHETCDQRENSTVGLSSAVGLAGLIMLPVAAPPIR